MIAARTSHPPALDSAMIWLCAALAVALHGALLFAWKYAPEEGAAATIEGDSVEVALVESAAAAAAIAVPQPPVAQPEPAPVPPPEPPKKEPEMVLPEPPKPTPPPRTASAATPSPKATPQPASARRNPAPRNSTAAGTAGGASAPAGIAASGTGIGRNAKASYVVPPNVPTPVPKYLKESRAAGEHGVVILRLVVDGNGRPTSVGVAKSSGFPRLDRAAVEAGWRCRVRDAAAGSQLDAPVRFNLSER